METELNKMVVCRHCGKQTLEWDVMNSGGISRIMEDKSKVCFCVECSKKYGARLLSNIHFENESSWDSFAKSFSTVFRPPLNDARYVIRSFYPELNERNIMLDISTERKLPEKFFTELQLLIIKHITP